MDSWKHHIAKINKKGYILDWNINGEYSIVNAELNKTWVIVNNE